MSVRGSRGRHASAETPPTQPFELPLAVLRMLATGDGAAAQWTIDPDGLSGRGLLAPAGAAAVFNLAVDTPLRLRGTARLLPHDWRDGAGALIAEVDVSYPGGGRERLWSARIGSAADGGALLGSAFELPLPTATVALTLRLRSAGVTPGPAVARAVWLEPRLLDTGITETRAHERPEPVRRHRSRGTGERPLISVVTPVHDPPIEILREAVESVREQTFDNWQLCLVDDGSRDPEVIDELPRYAAADDRIVTARHQHAEGISAATNMGLEIADGEYVALLDHDDTLAPTALERVAEAIAADPSLDMIYTDEDIVLDGRPVWVHRKPGWSPDTLRTNGYTCHLGVYRRALVDEIGGFRTEFNGSQDVDMILRLTERTDRVGHVPEVLYHWRMHVDSTAGGDAKPYAYVAAAQAIAGHLDRVEMSARVGYGPPGLYRVVYEVDPGMSVSIVLALADTHGLAQAATTWLEQPHHNWQLVIAAPHASHPPIHDLLTTTGIPAEQITLIDAPADTDPHTALATAAHHATTDQLLLCQHPAAGLTHDWLTRLLGYSHQPHIAAAGPIILTPGGRIQDAGIAIPNGIPLPLLNGMRTSMDEFFGYGTSVYNVAAVSGVLATGRSVHDRLGGLRPEYGSLALVDYCLRAHAHQLRTVIVPDARLTATGPDHTTNDLPALRRLATEHPHGDPYYNAGWRSDHGDFAVAAR